MQDFDLTNTPLILDIRKDADKESYDGIKSKAIIIDRIYSQLYELVKLKNPKLKLNPEIGDKLIREHLKDISLEEYGLWIYYPWSNKLVHIVYENEFIELRTIRNKYKITREEQDILQRKKIGIVGLSVGHAIAMTMASERICSELRLADFDELELSNINRIRTGIQNLGLKKTIIASREIAEIDPFIKVKCFNEGINDENLLDFLTGDGKLDVCVEECDGFYEKFNIRYKCKELKIPVVMDTSDKGLIDIERFDLEPERKIFHGLTNVADINKLRNLTSEQKIPYLYQIIDEESMSTRLRASLIEIEDTITGWPQLASAVSYGSGITTDVVRRMLLKQFNSSGRFSIDIESLIKDKDISSEEDTMVTEGSMNIDFDEIIHDESNQAILVDKSIVEKIVSDAITAPSGGNSQPWKWVSSGNSLFVFLDRTRCSPYTDLNDWGAILAIGCAVENLILSANHYGFGMIKEILKLEEKEFGIKFTFTHKNDAKAEKIYDEKQFDVIRIRQSNRNNCELTDINKDHKEQLIKAVESIPHAHLKIIEDRKQIAEVANLIAEADIIRFLNKFLFKEMMHEIRWDKKEAIEKPYGVELDLFDISAKDKIGFKIAGSWSVASFVKKIGGNALGDMSRKLLLQSSAIALVTMPEMNAENFLNGGMSIERFWLSATQNKLAIHPFAAQCYFFMRLEIDAVDFFSSSEIATLRRLKKRWNEIFETPNGGAEMFFCKLSYAPPAARSQRIPLEQVIEFR